MSGSKGFGIARRRFVQAMLLAGFSSGLPISGLTGVARSASSSGDPVTLWGIPASPSAVFARAVEAGISDPQLSRLTFDIWKNTDQMRAGIASGEFKLFATSSYAAANFHNRGAGVVLANIATWGVLYLMARDAKVRRIEDLAGKRVLLSNKNEAPDLLFRLVLKWSGLDPDKDVTLDYVGSPMEAVPLFLKGRADVALLHEPAATVALLKAKKAGINLTRAIDITESYGNHTGRGPRIPQVGLAMNERFLEANANLIRSLHEALVEAGDWVSNHPEQAGELAAKSLPLSAPILSKSLPYSHLDVKSAKDAKEDIELYFQHLMSLDARIVGGRLPDKEFYWG